MELEDFDDEFEDVLPSPEEKPETHKNIYLIL